MSWNPPSKNVVSEDGRFSRLFLVRESDERLTCGDVMQDLSIDHCIIESQPELFQGLAEALSKLRRFSARGCAGLDEASLGYLTLGCQRLDTVILSHCRLLKRWTWMQVPGLASLKILDLTGSGLDWAAGFLPGLEKCTELVELSVAHCSSLGASSQAFQKFLVHVAGLRKLSVAKNAAWVDDATLESISTHCKVLEHLNLAGCTPVTDSGLRHLLACRSLSSLNISDCKLVTEDGLVQYVQRNGALELIWCNGIAQGDFLNQKTVFQILRDCKRIKKLAVKIRMPTEFSWENGKLLRLLPVS